MIHYFLGEPLLSRALCNLSFDVLLSVMQLHSTRGRVQLLLQYVDVRVVVIYIRMIEFLKERRFVFRLSCLKEYMHMFLYVWTCFENLFCCVLWYILIMSGSPYFNM